MINKIFKFLYLRVLTFSEKKKKKKDDGINLFGIHDLNPW